MSLFAEQEYFRNDANKGGNSHIGLKNTLWEGDNFHADLVRDLDEWDLSKSKDYAFDVGFDKSKTIELKDSPILETNSTLDNGDSDREVKSGFSFAIRSKDWEYTVLNQLNLIDEKAVTAGLSLGMMPAKNIQIEVGYNIEGFDDEGFTSSHDTRESPYLSVNYLLDQSLLNKLTKPRE